VVLTIAAAALAWWLFRSRPPSIPSGAFRGHNVLLLTIVTLHADRLGSYGSETPPALQADITRARYRIREIEES